MYISTTSFAQGSLWDARLNNAMWYRDNVNGSGFNYYVGRDTDGTHDANNGKNEAHLDASL